jgi:leucyl-tRNA synthetase
MAVPAHDQRDFEFAKKYNLNISKTIFTKEEMEGFDSYLEPENYDNFMNNVVFSKECMIND